jgi:hypothetical protein
VVEVEVARLDQVVVAMDMFTQSLPGRFVRTVTGRSTKWFDEQTNVTLLVSPSAMYQELDAALLMVKTVIDGTLDMNMCVSGIVLGSTLQRTVNSISSIVMMATNAQLGIKNGIVDFIDSLTDEVGLHAEPEQGPKKLPN